MHHVSQQTAVPTRRERVRAATIDEIKETALRLMHSTGTTDLKFSEIARAMGLTAPALYRYFADSDALLTELVVDAFDDLGAGPGAVGLSDGEEAAPQVVVRDVVARGCDGSAEVVEGIDDQLGQQRVAVGEVPV